MSITRSAGLSTGLGAIVGGGYSGKTEELDRIVQQEAKALAKAFGRDVVIRFNSDRLSGGAWLKDTKKGFEGSSQVGLTAHTYPEVPKGMTRHEWYESIAKRVGWGKEHTVEVEKAPTKVYILTYLSGDIVRDRKTLNEGNVGSRYASHEHDSVASGLRFILAHVNRSKLSPVGSNSELAENAAIHAYYDEHPRKDKLRKAKSKSRRVRKVQPSVGGLR